MEFFIDRSLGRKHLASALRDRGFTVHTMADLYGEQEAQRLADEDWLRDVGRRGWVVLMKDTRIRYRTAEREALIEGGVRAFCLTAGQLGAAEQTRRFVDNLDAIRARSSHPGPFIDAVQAQGLRRVWP